MKNLSVRGLRAHLLEFYHLVANRPSVVSKTIQKTTYVHTSSLLSLSAYPPVPNDLTNVLFCQKKVQLLL